jgi:cytochrome d ubiquinol oxidase subunit I
MVALGSMFSAIWIVVANSWMQTPAGYHVVGTGAEAGAWFVLSVSAYYLLKKKHIQFAQASIKIALVIAFMWI